MGRSIPIRLDDDPAAAPRLLGSEAVSESEAVRLALTEAADRRMTRHALREEALRPAPTASSALPATSRPGIEHDGTPIRVRVEQTSVVDPSRLDRSAGRLDQSEIDAIDRAVGLVFAP